MKAREWIAFAFLFSYAMLTALVAYLGRGSFTSGGGMIIITLFVASGALASFWAIWNLDIKIRHRENEALETVLQNLSSTDLLLLKRRLMDEELNENYIVNEEGEFLDRKVKR
jgi:hypothetical protein